MTATDQQQQQQSSPSLSNFPKSDSDLGLEIQNSPSDRAEKLIEDLRQQLAEERQGREEERIKREIAEKELQQLRLQQLKEKQQQHPMKKIKQYQDAPQITR